MKDLVKKLKELQKGLSNNADRARLDGLIAECEEWDARRAAEPVSKPPSPAVVESVIPAKPEISPTPLGVKSPPSTSAKSTP